MGSASNNPNESDVAKLLSMGFDRARAIQALEECGSLEDALNSLLTGSGGGGDGGGDGGRGSIIDADAKQRKDFLDRDIDWDSVDDPPLKLADSDGNEKVSVPTTLMENLHSHATNSTIDAPSQPLLAVGAHVEQIDDNVEPEPWQWNYDGDEKKSAALAARMERMCNDEPEPPTAMIFHVGDEKKSAVLAARMELANDIRGPEPPMFSSEQEFLDSNFKKSSALIGEGKGAAFDSTPSNFETTNSFISFDSLEGENYFRDDTNNRVADIFPNNNHCQVGVNSTVTARSDVNDEEKNDSIDSKSDSGQEEYIAVIPEAFLVEEDTEEEIIQATLVEPTPPWWKMRRAQQMFCFVILLIVPLSLSLGIFISPSRNQDVVNGAVPPAISLAPSAAREVVGATVPTFVADTSSQPSPAAAPACSLDSNCGATLEIWRDIMGPNTYDLRLYTNALSNEPNETNRLWSLLEAPTNFGDNYGSRMKGWLIPPVTGNYTFWIASDDSSELWLSTDEDPANVELVCYDYNFVASREWDAYPEQESSPIWLVAGQSYYYQALLKEENDGDHLAIAWQYPGQELQVIPAEYSQIAGPYTYINTLFPTMSPKQPANCSSDSHCGAILETWTGIEGVSAVDLYWGSNSFLDLPDRTERIWDLLEVPSNSDENYGDIMEGWLVPPVTGDYTFWIASDNNGEFFFNANYGFNTYGWTLICSAPESTGKREWDRFSEQKSEPIGLVKDQPYLFQIRRKQGTDDNHLAIAWQHPGQTREVIPAMYSRTSNLAFTCLDCGATVEIWKDIEGRSVDDLRLGSNNFLFMPSNSERLWTLLEAPSNIGENLGRRMKGWLMPPVTGNYTFYIASDDHGELWLSNDDNHLFLACNSPIGTYGTYSRAWTWFPHQESSPIWLVAGQAYYYEALMKQSGGWEFLAIAWRYPGQELQVIPAKHSRITNPSICLDSDCGANLETWTGISGNTIVDLMVGTNDFANTPNRTERLSSLLEIVADQGDNYGIRMTGWLLPPASGSYLFWIASDDAGELWLSTDDDPANKGVICNCSSNVWYREFTEQRSEQIELVAGQAYYFEGLMKEGGDGDHFAIAWEYPGQYREVIPANFSRTTRPNSNNTGLT